MACRTCSQAEKCVEGFGEDAWSKGPFGRPRCEWENNMNSFLKSTEDMEWVNLAKDRDV
jgi:hypothetical protein